MKYIKYRQKQQELIQTNNYPRQRCNIDIGSLVVVKFYKHLKYFLVAKTNSKRGIVSKGMILICK